MKKTKLLTLSLSLLLTLSLTSCQKEEEIDFCDIIDCDAPDEAYEILSAFSLYDFDSLLTSFEAVYYQEKDTDLDIYDNLYLGKKSGYSYGYRSLKEKEVTYDYYYLDREEYIHIKDDSDLYLKYDCDLTYESLFKEKDLYEFRESFDFVTDLIYNDQFNNHSYFTKVGEYTYTLQIYEDNITYIYISDFDFNILGLSISFASLKTSYTLMSISQDVVTDKMNSLNPNLWLEASSDGLHFELNSDKKSYYVSSYDTSLDQMIVSIPSEYNGLPVSAIGNPAESKNDPVFSGSTTKTNYLHAVIIPESVTTISSYAFYQCYGLSYIYIPSSVTSIGDYAFSQCTGLSKVEIEAGLTSISQYAFNECYALVSINIPDSVTSISNRAFYKCYSLTSIDLPSSLKSLGTYVFYDCYALKEVSLSIQTISERSFYNCRSLTKLTLNEGVLGVDTYAFYNCYALKEVIFPTGLIVLGNYSFYNCYALNKVYIPSSLIQIGSYPFYNSYGMEVYYQGNEEEYQSINISTSGNTSLQVAVKHYNCDSFNKESIDYILDSDAFTYLLNSDGSSYSVIGYDSSKQYRAIQIPSIYNNLPVTGVGKENGSSSDCVFSSSKEETNYLGYIKLPDSIRNIYPYAFDGSYSLKEINIPSSVTRIYDYAFRNCYNLTSLSFSEDSCLESIGSYAFYQCYGLTSVNLPASLLSIGESCFASCFSLSQIELPEGLETLSYHAFYSCYGLERVSIPSSITSFGDEVFSNCYSLYSVNIDPEFNSELSEGTFSGCYALNDIMLPDLKCIPSSFFSGCYGLSSIYIPSSITSIKENAFKNNYALSLIYYQGNKDEFNEISINETGNDFFLKASVYYYSETKPKEAGNFWHFVNNVPTIY